MTCHVCAFTICQLAKPEDTCRCSWELALCNHSRRSHVHAEPGWSSATIQVQLHPSNLSACVAQHPLQFGFCCFCAWHAMSHVTVSTPHDSSAAVTAVIANQNLPTSGQCHSSATKHQLAKVVSQSSWLCCRRVTDRQTGRHRGFGFCEYYHMASAHAAIKQINGQQLQGRRLKIAALGVSGKSFTLIIPMNCL